MASRDVLDTLVDVYKDQAKDGQNQGRGNGTWGANFGQTLINNGRPSDQPNDGPQLPALLSSDAWIDVYESPQGFGWQVGAIAVEGPDSWIKYWVAFEDGDLVPGTWEPFSEDPIQVAGLVAPETLWETTKRWIAHPIDSMRGRA
jgi:hypothetical protein